MSAPPEGVTNRTSRLRLHIAYLGTSFRGFALQPGDIPTVAGTLGAVVSRHLRYPVEMTCAGRTDAGVHAWGQVVSMDAPAEADLDRLVRAVNKVLAPDVVIRSARWESPGFSARHDALWRLYRYRILTIETPDPFRAGVTWWVPEALDLAALRLACDPLYGEHDFSSFCRKPPVGSLVRLVELAEWSRQAEGELRFEIRATSFCQQMVRSLVGTMVDMGRGRLKAGDMAHILRSGDRSVAGQLAPPQGLCLWEVGYPDPLNRSLGEA